MPPLGKSQSDRPRKPFDLADHNQGEQVNAVRSKIASLLDGMIEKTVDNAPNPSSSSSTSASSNTASSNTVQSQSEMADTTEDRAAVIDESDATSDRDSSQEMWAQRPVTTGENPAQNVIESTTNGLDAPLATSAQPDISEQSRWQPTTPEEPAVWPRRTVSRSDGAEAEGTQPDMSAHRPFSANDGYNQSSTGDVNQFDVSATAAHQEDRKRNWGDTSAPSETTIGRDFAADDMARTDSTADIVVDDDQFQNVAQPEQAQATSEIAAINIKGRAGGILIEIGRGEWSVIMRALAERLSGATNFFRNGQAALDLADRSLAEEELNHLYTLLKTYAVELVLIHTASPETFQLALDMGLAAQLESNEGETTAAAQPGLSNLVEEQHFIYSGHLRAGQVLQRKEHILIIGDVNPGATVISNGDILVWGHLRGMAHAGASGSGGVICALDLSPVQIRIGELIAVAPEQPKPRRGWGRARQPVRQPEVAYQDGDQINVEPWDATRFGGIATIRRRQ